MVEQSLDRQELLLFLLLDNTNVLAKLDQIPIKLLLGFFFLLLSENEIDFISHAHALVLLLIVDSVGLRVCWFPLNQPVHLIPLFIHGFLGRNQLFELVDQVMICPIVLLVALLGAAGFPLDMCGDLLLVTVFLHLVSLLFGLEALVQDALEFCVDRQFLQAAYRRLRCLRVIPVGEHLD